jgi:hypothetical protein
LTFQHWHRTLQFSRAIKKQHDMVILNLILLQLNLCNPHSTSPSMEKQNLLLGIHPQHPLLETVRERNQLLQSIPVIHSSIPCPSPGLKARIM